MNKTTDSSQKRINRKRVQSQKFFEALRDLGEGVVETATQEMAKGVAESALSQLTGLKKSGELKPNEALDLNQTQSKEEFLPRTFRPELSLSRYEEKAVFTREEQETQLQIKAVLEELKNLAQSTKGLAREIEIATEQMPVDPGTYHLNFFEKLRETILLFRKRVEETTTWLAAFNHRSKKRSFYWAQVKKSGTKFMLSQERYMSTQAG